MFHNAPPSRPIIAMVAPSKAARSVVEECQNRLDHTANAKIIAFVLDGMTVRCSLVKSGKTTASVTSN